MADSSSPTFSANGLRTPDSASAPADNAGNGVVNPLSKPSTNGLPSDASAQSSAVATTAPTTFPPPKTDKPRPHVCTTCMRSFARLEHLKRHERSHTKEKPFECPSCTRCFARRDLLLRHQQKLHSTTTPASKPRNGRRESTTGVATGRVRKNSMAGTPATAMRPRANTLSHIDSTSLGMSASGAFGRQFAPVHGHHSSFSGEVANPSFGFRSMGGSMGTAASGLPRLETHGLPQDGSSGLRTAPPYGGFGTEFEMGGMTSLNNGNTINPHALHVHGQSSYSNDNPWDSQHFVSGMPTAQTLTEEDGFDWVTHGFENQMSFSLPNENAIDDSSPSAMSTNSPAQFNENGQVTNHGYIDGMGPGINGLWQQNMMNMPHVVNSPMSMDVNPFFSEMPPQTGDTISPQTLLAQKPAVYHNNFPTPPDMTSMDLLMSNGGAIWPRKHDAHASTASTGSMDGSFRNGSVTMGTPELVTEQMRNVLIAGLNQCSGFGLRKQSQPAISSPLSPPGGVRGKAFNANTFPTTHDLRRYVAAYIRYYHPHLPFLHIPTLNFDACEYGPQKNSGTPTGPKYTNVAGGGSCLMLSIAALGALFENEMFHSKELFECAKRLISSYLEERRKLQNGKTHFVPHQRTDQEDTPLWLVQAMLLNVIYGHNCGDKQAADIASNHCAALVSLARGAELAKPYPTYLNVNRTPDGHQTNHALSNGLSIDGWSASSVDPQDSDWYEWKIMEERKRTLYAIFVLSSMLVTAYNRAPALTNSEIRLDLPCDEDLWSTDSPQAWRMLGGIVTAQNRSVPFASALTHLLTAAQRKRRAVAKQRTGEAWQEEEMNLQPSSFGCLILINALHNYIWETRQRHLGRQWTTQEIESMHAHIEPALSAWQAAWRSNPTHAVERPNPYGAGPLSADSIPLLDLAYVRLFVDFGRSKEAYWQRDYDAMAQELAKGSDFADGNPISAIGGHTQSDDFSNQGLHIQISDNMLESETPSAPDAANSQPSQRERHLRKAAFYAADHLTTSDRLGFGLNEYNARELPIQSVLCACDSAQVLAEWATTVQERVGRFVGVLGKDEVDFSLIPAILLDDEDRKLLTTIEELLTAAEGRQEFGMALIHAREGGYGSRILVLTSEVMTRAAIWPVTKLMARSLETQSGHIKARVARSVRAHM